ncbi:hypothetical protein CAL7716_015900 [Calothrix sp. PCC 7716]|nr:hypothetical protein CAL7716_015900 [Calothrix sp. PCC 7716]
MVTLIDSQSGLSEIEMLNQGMHHKIANEIAILKSIAYDILEFSQNEDLPLSSIVQDIDYIFSQITCRKTEGKLKIAEIPHNDYEKKSAILSQTAHDISDFVNKKLAVIKSEAQLAILQFQPNTPHYKDLNKFLVQLELTQAALDDLKTMNEGIVIKHHNFLVKKLFERWETNPKIQHATIYLDIRNGNQEFKGDEEKIKSAIQELVENSLKHNPDKPDLEIHITSKDVVNLPESRDYNISSEQKYLLIEFADNGKGVPDDKKDWIFQPLKTTSPRGKGNGLGLFIIRKTLAKMNAYIHESGKNGVKFEIFIPYENDTHTTVNH